MNLTTIENLKINAWYRGFKLLTVVSIIDNLITISNGDKIKIDDNGHIYLNKVLICTDTEITEEQLIQLYKYLLVKKGYKILNYDNNN